MSPSQRLLSAIVRLLEAPSYTDIPEADIRRYGKAKAYILAFNVKKEAQTFAETLDNVRAALKLKDTHYLVIPDQVADMVEATERLQGGPPSKHGPYCRVFKRMANPDGKPGDVKVFCGEIRGHEGPHEFARCL